MDLRSLSLVGLVSVALAAGCTIDGKMYPCEVGETCEADSAPDPCAEGPCGDGTPPDLQATAVSGAVAVGGTLDVTVTSRSGAPLHYQAVLPLAVRALRDEPGRLELEVTCGATGLYVVTYGSPAHSGTQYVTCSEATRVEASLKTLVLPTEPAVYFVATGAPESDRTVRLTMRDSIGRELVDGSFAVTPASVPELIVRDAHELLLPTTPGTFDVVISSQALGQMPRRFRVVDHVDTIVGERTSGTAGAGSVCFYGLAGDDLVMGAQWRLTTSGIHDTFPTDANCIGYKAATGAVPRVEVQFAGITQSFALDTL